MNAVVKPLSHTLDDFRYSMEESVQKGEHEKIEPPVDHFHTPDLYGRRIFVPGGTAIVTKVHKTEHITVALRGHCTVVDEDGVKQEVIAPAVFITKPGTQRAVYAHDDVEWITVHACKEQDMARVETALVCDTMADYDREDYAKVLAEAGITEEQARALTQANLPLMHMPSDETLTQVMPSAIQGAGLFAVEDIDAGRRIAPARIGNLKTPAGRYTNHSANPNAEFRLSEQGIDLYAVKPIPAGIEITVCYRQAQKIAAMADSLTES